MLVGPSVRPLVSWLLLHFFGELKVEMKTDYQITAPAQQHSTDAVEYTVLYISEKTSRLDLQLMKKQQL